MAKKQVSELEKRTVNALRRVILVNPGIETKLLRGYLALQLMTENGRLPYGGETRLVKLPTSRHLIAMLRRDRRVRFTNRNRFFLRWYVVEKKVRRIFRKPEAAKAETRENLAACVSTMQLAVLH